MPRQLSSLLPCLPHTVFSHTKPFFCSPHFFIFSHYFCSLFGFLLSTYPQFSSSLKLCIFTAPFVFLAEWSGCLTAVFFSAKSSLFVSLQYLFAIANIRLLNIIVRLSVLIFYHQYKTHPIDIIDLFICQFHPQTNFCFIPILYLFVFRFLSAFCPSVCILFSLLICLSVCLCLSVSVSLCLSVSVCVSVCLWVFVKLFSFALR